MSGATATLALGKARANLIQPTDGNGIGVLLYPTIFGLSAAMQDFASDLAADGFTVMIWDPYDGEPVGADVMAVVAKSKLIEDECCLESLGALTDHMQGPLGLTSIGGVGWCFGGRIGLLHAGRDSRVKALCSYNPTILPIEPIEVQGAGVICRGDCPGQTLDEFESAEHIVGPVQVTRPGHDFTQPEEYQRLVDSLFAREAPTFYEYYPKVGHGFSYTPGAENEAAQSYAWANSRQLLSTLATPAIGSRL